MESEIYLKAGKQPKNLQLIKDNNFTLVFNMINEHQPISRAQLAKLTRLSPTTISSQVDELLQKKLVAETGVGEMGTSGRKPIMINTNENGHFVVSIEMVKDGFDCVLYNLSCQKKDSRRYFVEDFDDIGNRLIHAVDEILSENGLERNDLIGITVGVPALIDYERLCVVSSTVLPIEKDNDFFHQLKDRFSDIPVFLENESGLCAYAEKVFGDENDVDNLMFIDVGNGIGSGIIMDGNMYRGSFGLAGEIGHISIDINGPKCKCGNRGCLEIMASIPAMVQRIVFAIMSGRETMISQAIQNDLNKISIDVIAYAMKNQDKLALEVVRENAARFAFGLNNVINLFNPESLVIGGEIVKLGGDYLALVKKYLSGIELGPNVSKVKIRFSHLTENAATLGGARYMLDTIFHSPKLLKSVV